MSDGGVQVQQPAREERNYQRRLGLVRDNIERQIAAAPPPPDGELVIQAPTLRQGPQGPLRATVTARWFPGWSMIALCAMEKHYWLATFPMAQCMWCQRPAPLLYCPQIDWRLYPEGLPLRGKLSPNQAAMIGLRLPPIAEELAAQAAAQVH